MTTWMTHALELGNPWAADLIGIALRGSVLLTLAALAALLLRRRSAALRHLVWTVAIGAVLALPVFQAVLPALPLATVPRFVSDPGPGEPSGRSTVGALRAEPLTGTTEAGTGEAALTGPASVPPARFAEARANTTEPPAPAEDASTPVAPTTPDEASTGLAIPSLPLGSIFVAVWLVGATAALSRLALGVFRAASLTHGGRPVSDPRTLRLAAEARGTLGLDRPVSLVWSERTPVPMTWGLRDPVLLLPPVARQWTDERLRQVLLHEQAHVVRSDYAWSLMAEVARAIHWMNPLVWLAAFRARIERERACDDRVLRAGPRPSDYAENLVGVARALRGDWRPRAAVLPMARPRELSTRVESILATDRPRTGVRRRTAFITAVAAAAVALPLSAVSAAPAERARPERTATPTDRRAQERTPARAETIPAASPAVAPGSAAVASPSSQESCFARDSDRRNTRINEEDRRTVIEWSRDDCEVELDMRGEVEFSSDDSGIERMGPDARFELDEEIDGDTRRLRAEAGADGRPAYRYWEDGEERPFEPRGREWLRAVLPEIFRHTTLNSEARARRILDRGGVDGLLAEIERMSSDHAAAAYFGHLLGMAELGEAETREILALAGRRLDSDHYRARVLTAVVRDGGLPPSVRDVYLDATMDLDSDHYKHRALQHLLDEPDLDPATLDAVLRTAADIESDHFHSRILREVIRTGRVAAEGRAAFLASLRDLESDHFTSRVLESFLDAGDLSSSEVAAVLDLTGEIESAHYRSEVLGRVAREHRLDGPAREAYLRAARGIESDHHASKAAQHLLDREELDDDQVLMVIRMSEDIDSDHFRSRLLVSVSERYPLTGELRDAYIRAARGIDSSRFRDRALAKLVNGG